MIWLPPTLSPTHQQVVSLSPSSCVSPVELSDRRGVVRGWGRSQITRESLMFSSLSNQPAYLQREYDGGDHHFFAIVQLVYPSQLSHRLPYLSRSLSSRCCIYKFYRSCPAADGREGVAQKDDSKRVWAPPILYSLYILTLLHLPNPPLPLA